jgi:hypothetical protein
MDLLEPLRNNWFLNSSNRMTTRIAIPVDQKVSHEYQVNLFKIIEKTKLIEGAIIGLVA